MGCSPSKGKLFSKPENPGPQGASSAEAPQEVTHSGDTVKSIDLTTDDKENELLPLTEEQATIKDTCSQLTSNTTEDQSPDDSKEKQVIVTTQETADGVLQTTGSKNAMKRKRNKSKKRLSEKQRFAINRVKLDFPPQTVRAHQAAYAYLNPNISKYETLLGLLDQAAQTQLSLQPMMSALVLRFEEINQALEELAEEGDLMMKEYGDYMALSSGMMGPVMQSKPNMGTVRAPDPPPDLLQQLLQHSVEKMRLVGSSVQELGDTTLEDAIEYYASLSKVLFEKLQAKQNVEQRLTQVLTRIEGAAMRKFNPEDSALHSEDSGIGGENESLPGSERHRHRGSAGSSSCGSGVVIRGTYGNPSCNSTNLAGRNVHDGDDEEAEDEDDDEYEDLEQNAPIRSRSNSSPPDPSHSFLYLQANYQKDLQPTVKRPLTAANPKCSSAICGNIKAELRSSKRDLDRQMQKMQIKGYRESAGPEYNLNKPVFRRHSLSGSQKDLSQENHSLCTFPSVRPQPPKSTSVRKLINTFSQGVDGRPGQNLAKILPHIKPSRKSGHVLLSDTGKGSERTSIINGNNNNNGWPDSKEYIDTENLPPPPPEVLMDDSFQATDTTQGSVETLKENSSWSPPIIIQNNRISQRLKASVQNVEVLPSIPRVQQRPITILAACPVRKDAGLGEIQDKKEYYEDELSYCNLPITAPPVSRVRLPPSCPSVCHRFPSPPTFRPQNSSQPSSRPGSPRHVEHATPHNVEVIVPSVSFNAARSVFCGKESQNSQYSGFRGRLLIRRSSNSTHRTQSEQRPCMTSNSEFTKNDITTVSQVPDTGSANAE